jgi:DNA-binding response OmpR family regulator
MDEHEKRAGRPLVCVTDGKAHIRKFLREMLGEYGFTIYECVEIDELSAALDAGPPDLVVLGLTAGAIVAAEMLRLLAAHDFEGKILPIATRDSAAVTAIQDLAEELRIVLLPPLLMPLARNACTTASPFS